MPELEEPREPPLAIEFENLEPGDILLFRPSIREWPIQKGITYFQKKFPTFKTQGHYDTTHVGIFVCQDAEGLPRISHINDIKWDIQRLGPIDEIDYDSEQRAFLVFRHKNKAAQEKIFRLATLNSNKELKWDIYIALRAMFRFVALDPKRSQKEKVKALSDRTICSKFVAECIKQVARDLDMPENFLSTITPETLESKLYSNDNYQMFLYPGKNLYLSIKNEINNQMHKIKSAADKITYSTLTHYLESPDLKVNETYKTVSLLSVMVPILKKHNKVGDVEDLARKRGIFDRDYEGFDPQLAISFLKEARAKERPTLNPEEISQLKPSRR